MDFGNTKTSPVRKGKGYGDTLKKGASGEPVFGRPSKPREEEPPLSDLMSWQPQTVDKTDFKKNKKDLLHFEDPQFEFYRSKIQKADNPWVSEARDNYRNFKDPEKDINVRHYNPYSGEYSAPIPANMNGSGNNGNRAGTGVGAGDMQHHSMRSRRAEYPTAAGNEYGTSLPGMGGSPQAQHAQMMLQQQQYQQGPQYGQQYAQYGQQGPNQAQLMPGQQHPAMMNSMQSMLNPSQVEYPGGDLVNSMPLRSASSANRAAAHVQDLKFTEEGQDEFMNNEGEEIDAEQAALDRQHMKDFLRTSRWKANTYTQKVLARPAFCNYGYKNVNPSVGGFLYGQYLHSHNVNPQRGVQPEYRQIYKNAQRFGDRVPPHMEAQIPRPKPPTINEEKVTENEMKRNSLEAEKLSPEKDNKRKTGTMRSSGGQASATVRPASAGRMPNSNSVANMQGNVARPQQSAINIQNQYQIGQQQPMQQSQGHLAPKITVTPADLDKQRAQNMNAADKERLMAKIAKDSGYPGNNGNNYLSPQNMNQTVKMGGQPGGRPGAPQVGFVDQLSETKKMIARKESGYDGASSIGKYPAYDDDFLEIGSGF